MGASVFLEGPAFGENFDVDLDGGLFVFGVGKDLIIDGPEDVGRVGEVGVDIAFEVHPGDGSDLEVADLDRRR